MTVYLDNSATTKPVDSVISAVNDVMLKTYGNPSSVHQMGLDAERIVYKARQVIAKEFSVTPDEVYFTSGATESNNTAIFGVASANKRRGNHIITSKIEHPSILSCFAKLEKEGIKTTYINVDKNGVIDLEELKNSLTENTILVSVMSVNNELGTIEPIEEIAKLKREFNFILHTDAVQAFKKIPINKFDMADLISISGHKIHALKGVGTLIVKKGVKINPLIYGGGQESDFRSGTENVCGIASMSAAISEKSDFNKIAKLKEQLRTGLLAIPNIRINADIEASAPHILSATFLGKRAEVILHSLEAEGIFVSAGSACHSNKFGESHVLKSIGMNKADIGATIRFSLGYFNTTEEIDIVIEKIKSLRVL